MQSTQYCRQILIKWIKFSRIQNELNHELNKLIHENSSNGCRVVQYGRTDLLKPYFIQGVNEIYPSFSNLLIDMDEIQYGRPPVNAVGQRQFSWKSMRSFT
jgi:hypothetical protein